jgi:hypothetical protein
VRARGDVAAGTIGHRATRTVWAGCQRHEVAPGPATAWSGRAVPTMVAGLSARRRSSAGKRTVQALSWIRRAGAYRIFEGTRNLRVGDYPGEHIRNPGHETHYGY